MKPHRFSRREALALGAGAFVVASLPFVRGRRRLYRRCLPIMGTLAEVAVVHDDEGAAREALDAAFAELRIVDRTMSRFRAESDVGRANLHASREAVFVTQQTADVLGTALLWAHVSEGRFDPCLGRATEAWDPARRTAPPAREDFARLAGQRLYRHLDLGDWRGRPAIRFGDEAVALDLGGIAKGHAVDRASEALRVGGIRDGLVNAGGDLYALGTSEDGEPWRVGVRSPTDPDRLVGTLQISDAAVATSGDYERCFEHAGRRFHHLLDPATAAPRVSDRHSVTVVADTCLDADAAATATFGMERTAAAALLRRGGSGARLARGV